MRLALSSAAAPDADLAGLVEACRRRGLTALELREGGGHGVAALPTGMGGEEARRQALDAGVALSGIRSAGGGSDLRLARLAMAAGAPVLVNAARDVALRLDRAAGLRSVGADVAIVVAGDDAVAEAERAVDAGFDVAWDAVAPDATAVDAGAAVERMLGAVGDRLRHVRVPGGPETAMHEGRGIGALMGRLTLAGYQGTIVLAPSSPRYRVAWEHWLGRRGGWGCGSKASDPTLVPVLSHTAGGAA